MNKVIGTLAVVAFASSMANAELLKNFKADGSVEALGQRTNNATDFNSKTGDKTSDVLTRVTVNAGFDLNEDANAVVTVVKNNRNYGTASESATTDGAARTNGILDNMYFEQAYLNLKGVFGIDHKVGRQYYGNNGDIVIYYGPQDWYVQSLGVTALDGWTGNWNKDKWSASALLAKEAYQVPVDPTLAPPTTRTGDRDVYGLTAAYDYSDIVKPSAFYYEKKNYGYADTDDLQVIGVKANGMYKGFNYGAEYAMNNGKNWDGAKLIDYRGYAVKANVDYGFDLAGKLTAMGEFAMGSGDKNATDSKNKAFTDINANYRPGLIVGGLTGWMTNLNNTTTWNVGANWNPSKVEKLNLCAKYFDFANTEKLGGVSRIGGEFDVVATWNHSKNVALNLGLGMFNPTKKFATSNLAVKNDAVTLVDLAMNVKF